VAAGVPDAGQSVIFGVEGDNMATVAVFDAERGVKVVGVSFHSVAEGRE